MMQKIEKTAKILIFSSMAIHKVNTNNGMINKIILHHHPLVVDVLACKSLKLQLKH